MPAPVLTLPLTNGKFAIETLLSNTNAGFISLWNEASRARTIAEVTGLQAALDGKSATGHTHAIADTTGLQAALDAKAATGHTHAYADITGKPSTFAPAAHTHAIADTTGLQAALDAKAAASHSHAYADITGKPTTFAPAAHTHAIADVTNLQTSLDGKAASSHTHSIAQVTSLQAALDSHSSDITAINTALNGKAATVHTHAIADTSGLQAALDAKAPLVTGINYINTVAYTLVLADSGRVIMRNNAAANTVTIPAAANVNFPVGTTIGVIQNGAGTTTIQSATGVTINGLTSNPIAAAARWHGLTLLKVASDEWVVSGGAV